MAENGVTCSTCTSQATALCFCKPELTYLCAKCVGTHWNTEGEHSLHSIRDYEELTRQTFTSKLEKRKTVVIVKSFLSARLKQIKRESLEYAGRLDNLQQDLKDTIDNKFQELRRVLDLAVHKLEAEVLSLQDEVQSYFTDQGYVSPLCEKMISQAGMLNRLLNDPIGTILTDCGLVEVDVNKLQSFRYKTLSLLIGGGSPMVSLYSFMGNDEGFSIFDPETEESTIYKLPPQDLIGCESSWCTLPNNDVFICGGVANMQKLASACILSTAIIDLEEIEPMFEARSTHGVLELNGYVYVFGGEGRSRAGLNSAERYHIDTTQWMDIKPLPAPLTKVSTVAFSNDIYLTGYNTYQIFLYFPDVDAYKPIKFAFERSYQSSCLLNYTDRMLVLRGADVLVLQIEPDNELKFQHKVTQTGQKYIWDIKGSPVKAVKKDLMYYYVFNSSAQTVFKIFMYGTRINITKVEDEEVE